MTTDDYDMYCSYVETASDEELYYESEDSFSQISDEDEGIKYMLCIAEMSKRRSRLYGK